MGDKVVWASSECISKPRMDANQRGFDFDFIDVGLGVGFCCVEIRLRCIKVSALWAFEQSVAAEFVSAEFFWVALTPSPSG